MNRHFPTESFRRNLLYFGLMAALATVRLTFAAGAQQNAPGSDGAGIEALHRQDVTATLRGDPTALANLFTDDAVLIEPGSPVVIGRRAILAENRKERAAHPQARTLAYKPEIRDLGILPGGWAIEWDYFDAAFRESPNAPALRFRGRALRVLRRQNDGSWKFSRVMWNTEK
jgi:uncharacterized protein (TIGR02246 family)